MRAQYGIPYHETGPSELEFDFFRPDHDETLPLVVFVHGGGWISGDRTMFRDEAIWLAEKGYACACPSYRLAPLHPFPAAVSDVQTMVAYARRESSSLAIDPTCVAVIGNSAGGHLAAMTALLDHPLDPKLDLGGFSPKADTAVAISPITDLTDPRGQHLPIAWSFLEQFMACPFEGHELLWHQASPLHHVSGTASPLLIIHGDEDDVVPVEQSQRLAEALTTAGAQTALEVLHGEMHSFSLEGWFRIRSLYLNWVGDSVGAPA
ncbi:MAG: hypothetical protein HONBIEJF_00859 [Fimbriimonadaceae bacterium]|nr:hypothetical protein [Fimbriimonadaceae bacterium]